MVAKTWWAGATKKNRASASGLGVLEERVPAVLRDEGLSWQQRTVLEQAQGDMVVRVPAASSGSQHWLWGVGLGVPTAPDNKNKEVATASSLDSSFCACNEPNTSAPFTI